MKQLLFLFLFSVCACFAHGQEPNATIKQNGDLVITTPVTVGGSLDTIITKGEETWRVVATISAQLISQEEIANQILSIESQIEAIARQEKDLLKLKRRLNNGKKSKAQPKSKVKN